MAKYTTWIRWEILAEILHQPPGMYETLMGSSEKLPTSTSTGDRRVSAIDEPPFTKGDLHPPLRFAIELGHDVAGTDSVVFWQTVKWQKFEVLRWNYRKTQWQLKDILHQSVCLLYISQLFFKCLHDLHAYLCCCPTQFQVNSTPLSPGKKSRKSLRAWIFWTYDHFLVMVERVNSFLFLVNGGVKLFQVTPSLPGSGRCWVFFVGLEEHFLEKANIPLEVYHSPWK